MTQYRAKTGSLLHLQELLISQLQAVRGSKQFDVLTAAKCARRKFDEFRKVVILNHYQMTKHVIENYCPSNY